MSFKEAQGIMRVLFFGAKKIHKETHPWLYSEDLSNDISTILPSDGTLIKLIQCIYTSHGTAINQVSAFLQSPKLQKAWMYLSHEVTCIQLNDNDNSNGIYLMRCSGNNDGSDIISHMFISSDATMTCCFDCQSEILKNKEMIVSQ